MIDEKNVKEWIDRFLDGATTNAEEQALYRYFEGNVPSSLKKYQPMFRWYASGMIEELPPKKVSLLRPLGKWIGIAASVIVICTVGLGIYRGSEQREYEFLEGSYIIRNGKKITDIRTILPELRQMNKLAISQEKQMDEMTSFDVDAYMQAMENNQKETNEDIPII